MSRKPPKTHTAAEVRKWKRQSEKRKNDPAHKRTPLWLLPDDLVLLDRFQRKFGHKTRMETLRKLFELGFLDLHRRSSKRRKG